MFERIIIFLVIILAAVLQISFFPNIFPSGSAPEAVLLLIIFWVSQNGYEKNWKRAIFAGIILDVFYFWPIGVNIMAISLTAFGIGYLTRRFSVSHKNLGFFVMLVIVIAGVIANNLFLSFFAAIYNHLEPNRINYPLLDFWNNKMIFRMLTNLMLFTLIYWPLLTLEKFLSFYDKKSMQGRFFR